VGDNLDRKPRACGNSPIQERCDMAENFVVFVQAFSMLFPIGLSGVTLIAFMKLRWLEPLNQPLDFGASIGGRRVFGDSKTIRGLLVHVVVATAVVIAIHAIGPAWWLAPQFVNEPIALGLAISLSYVAGELVNSFVKRRLGIGTGENAPASASVQRFVDNVDGSLANGIMFLAVYHVSFDLLVVAGAYGYALHEGTDVLMRRLRLKRKQ
jgi:predicted CDP-diglyceride synthetase/phosphatidate cytidylyltransferase